LMVSLKTRSFPVIGPGHQLENPSRSLAPRCL
jgi:hypothetical protein